MGADTDIIRRLGDDGVGRVAKAAQKRLDAEETKRVRLASGELGHDMYNMRHRFPKYEGYSDGGKLWCRATKNLRQAASEAGASVRTACKVAGSMLARSLAQTPGSRSVRDTNASAFR